MSTLMEVSGLICEFNMPAALKSQKLADGTEVPLGLPPYARQQAYSVDEYPACPDHWMHGNNKASSYFVGVEAGKGMWLDFNGCAHHSHDVAIIVSVQGINSVSGEPTIGGRFYLEQYREKCPKHGTAFQQDRFCPDCKFKWPAQNYLSTTGSRYGQLWLDGFRAADKVVRQYLFTEDEARGVAANKIGEDRVFAIGIAYFLSKDAKPKPAAPSFTRGMVHEGTVAMDFDGGQHLTKALLGHDSGLKSFGGASDAIGTTWTNSGAAGSAPASMPPEVTCSVAPARTVKHAVRSGPFDLSAFSLNSVTRSAQKASVQQVTPTKNYEVAAGARINQQVGADPKELTYWNDEPAGMIYVNYCNLDTLSKILKAGRREEEEDGMLAGINVGND